MDWSAIGAIAAICAAVLSSYTIVRMKWRRLSITFLNVLVGYGPDNVAASIPRLYIKVVNKAHRPVTINALNDIKIKAQDGQYLFSQKTLPQIRSIFRHNLVFPCDLEETGIPLYIWIFMKHLSEEARANEYSGNLTLSAEITDTLGKTYNSKQPYEFNIDE